MAPWSPPARRPGSRRPWPRGATAGSCYFCDGGRGGPRPVWRRHGVMACKDHLRSAAPGLKCLECGERPADAGSTFENFCLECGEEWRKYTVRGNPWSVAA